MRTTNGITPTSLTCCILPDVTCGFCCTMFLKIFSMSWMYVPSSSGEGTQIFDTNTVNWITLIFHEFCLHFFCEKRWKDSSLKLNSVFKGFAAFSFCCWAPANSKALPGFSQLTHSLDRQTSASVIAFASLLYTCGWASAFLSISVPCRSFYEKFRLISMYVPGIKYLMETLFCHHYKWTSVLYFRLHLKHTVCAHSCVLMEVFLTVLKPVGRVFNPHFYRRLDFNTKDFW